MKMSYTIVDKDIKLLKTQIDISDSDARNLLIKYNGDIVECVLDSYNFTDEISKKKIKINTQSKNQPITKQVNNFKIKVI